MAMAGGIILAAVWPDAVAFTMLAAASAATLSGVMSFSGHVATARLYRLPERAGKNLSGFYGDRVVRQLAQHVDPVAVKDEDGPTGQRQLLRDGRVVPAVRRRRNLSEACRSKVNLVIALVPEDYPSRCSASTRRPSKTEP